jgi:opacity protein-like surface antigen
MIAWTTLAPLLLPAAPLLPAAVAPETPVLAPAFESFALPPDPPRPAEPLFGRDTHEGGGLYLRLNGGLITTRTADGPSEDIEFKDGYLVAAAIGQRMSSGDQPLNFDLELEGVYTNQDSKDNGAIDPVGAVKTLGGFLNGELDFRVADRLSLYAAGGVGADWLDVDTHTSSAHNFHSDGGPHFAWQAKAGVMWHLTSATALTLGYRFMNIADDEVKDGLGGSSFSLQTEQHVIEVGLSFGL